MAVSLDAAREIVAAERRRCVDERKAFSAFRSTLAATAPTNEAGGGARALAHGANRTHVTTVETTSCAGEPVQRLRRAYRRTVMAVDHYEAEYGDSLAESVEDELGTDVRGVFEAGVLTPSAKRTLLGRVDVALDARESLLGILDDESESLADVSRRLDQQRHRLEHLDERPLDERGFGELSELWRELERMRADVETLAGERQRILNGRTKVATVDAPTYLFDGYPALHAIAERAATVEEARTRVERTLATRG